MYRHRYGTVKNTEILGCPARLFSKYFSGHDAPAFIKKGNLFGNAMPKTLAKQTRDAFLSMHYWQLYAKLL